jgi:hypothetical protein
MALARFSVVADSKIGLRNVADTVERAAIVQERFGDVRET